MNFKILRKLARSNKYQLLYSRAKDMALRLFGNVTDLTKIQIWFLYWLEIYSSLYTDLARKEKFLDKEVIEDDVRTDAYLMWREEKYKKNAQGTMKKRSIDTSGSNPSVIFKNRK